MPRSGSPPSMRPARSRPSMSRRSGLALALAMPPVRTRGLRSRALVLAARVSAAAVLARAASSGGRLRDGVVCSRLDASGIRRPQCSLFGAKASTAVGGLAGPLLQRRRPRRRRRVLEDAPPAAAARLLAARDGSTNSRGMTTHVAARLRIDSSTAARCACAPPRAQPPASGLRQRLRGAGHCPLGHAAGRRRRRRRSWPRPRGRRRLRRGRRRRRPGPGFWSAPAAAAAASIRRAVLRPRAAGLGPAARARAAARRALHQAARLLGARPRADRAARPRPRRGQEEGAARCEARGARAKAEAEPEVVSDGPRGDRSARAGAFGLRGPLPRTTPGASRPRAGSWRRARRPARAQGGGAGALAALDGLRAVFRLREHRARCTDARKQWRACAAFTKASTQIWSRLDGRLSRRRGGRPRARVRALGLGHEHRSSGAATPSGASAPAPLGPPGRHLRDALRVGVQDARLEASLRHARASSEQLAWTENRARALRDVSVKRAAEVDAVPVGEERPASPSPADASSVKRKREELVVAEWRDARDARRLQHRAKVRRRRADDRRRLGRRSSGRSEDARVGVLRVVCVELRNGACGTTAPLPFTARFRAAPPSRLAEGGRAHQRLPL